MGFNPGSIRLMNINQRIQLSKKFEVLVVTVVLVMAVSACSSGPGLEPWHTEKLTEEFTVKHLDKGVSDFRDYIELEQRLFEQLDKKVYEDAPVGPSQLLNRYSPGSLADPRNRQPNWNRSFELEGTGEGAVLLLHGMSDSPYSLRALGLALHQAGYSVIGLRLPGHGTAPSGMIRFEWQDMAAAVELAGRHLQEANENGSLHVVGYSNGATLALDYALRSLEDDSLRIPDSLILLSPSIRVHGAASMAGFKNSMSVIPGLGGLSWLTVMGEFDPYKYNSFTTNAGSQVHGITTNVNRRIARLSAEDTQRFPPVLAFKSTVDSTVTTEAVVDNLLMELAPDRNELVLFDVNRQAAIEGFIIPEPGPLTRRLFNDETLPFAVTFISNESKESAEVVARYKPPRKPEAPHKEKLGLRWPTGVISLSHVAVPFPPDDPLYGQENPEKDGYIFLGDLAIRGERGMLRLPEDWLLRMRYNPFYPYMEQRVLNWVNTPVVSQSE